MMTSLDIRQSFLDFFQGKEHTLVPSASLLPQAPNLLFTNAGMNPFVPFFLGQAPCPYTPARVADTQKCIRAGGKHNDLEEVGYDTYHHTFFEMLGNWSFGDYFKEEAITWAWELLVKQWKFPPERLYATVYQPEEGDPSVMDQESHEIWAKIFREAGLDPEIHICFGAKKDNFWMMGETGPCGPCSEIHMNLQPTLHPQEDRHRVNADDPSCIEIWNLVFIQFLSDGEGGYAPLPQKHVDTGMGLERIASIMQGTKGLQDFSHVEKISNYHTDLFHPLFEALEKLSGKSYGEDTRTDRAFRVIADHLRALTFAIGDHIVPSNEGRGYVLRRLLRRAVRYGRHLGLEKPFLFQLVERLVTTMGDPFPEIQEKAKWIQQTIQNEEQSFLQTLDRGIELFEKVVSELTPEKAEESTAPALFPGAAAFKLYDTYGFPLDLTQLMARERGLSVDEKTFQKEMELQRQRSQQNQKKEKLKVHFEGATSHATLFVGYDQLEARAEVVRVEDRVLITSSTPFYAEMGGQVGDTGTLDYQGESYTIVDTQKSPEGLVLHQLQTPLSMEAKAFVQLQVDQGRRHRIEAHHTGTHLLHWALRQVLGPHVVQRGSYVGPDRLRFDFAHSGAMEKEELEEVERLVQEHIAQKEAVVWEDYAYAQIQGDPSILQFFGDKYGDIVRVVTVGDGYSRELCGGTHVRNTQEIGFFKLLSEGAIAAGIRRIEACAGNALVDFAVMEAKKQQEQYQALQKRYSSLVSLAFLPSHRTAEVAWSTFTERQAQLKEAELQVREWEKEQAKTQAGQWQSQATQEAKELMAQVQELRGIPCILAQTKGSSSKYLTHLIDAFKAASFQGVVILAQADGAKVYLMAYVAPAYLSQVQSHRLIQTMAPWVGGRGGGRPEMAQGGGDQPENIPSALAQIASWLASHELGSGKGKS